MLDEVTLKPTSPLTLAEAAAISDLSLGQVTMLFPKRSGMILLRDALYAALLAELSMLEPTNALAIAKAGALEARLGRNQLLSVTWKDDEPVMSWVTKPPAVTASAPMLIVPVERMFTLLTDRLVELRAHSG